MNAPRKVNGSVLKKVTDLSEKKKKKETYFYTFRRWKSQIENIKRKINFKVDIKEDRKTSGN